MSKFSNTEDFSDELIECKVGDELSRWGNSFVSITREQIVGLLEGKAYFHFDGEYGTVIKLGGEE